MQILPVKIKLVHPDATIPNYGSDGAAAFDLIAVSERFDIENGYIEYDFGISFEIPEGYAGFVYHRSSNSSKDVMLTNAVGIIDSDYRGTVKARLKPVKHFAAKKYHVGDKVVQMVIMPIPKIQFEVVDNLSNTDRGDKGFGHTGS